MADRITQQDDPANLPALEIALQRAPDIMPDNGPHTPWIAQPAEIVATRFDQHRPPGKMAGHPNCSRRGMLFEVKLDGLACRPWDVQQKIHRVSSASGQLHFPLPPR